jgi:hypothetical protein
MIGEVWLATDGSCWCDDVESSFPPSSDAMLMEPAEPLDVGDHSALLLRWVFSACLTGESAVSGELDYHRQN